MHSRIAVPIAAALLGFLAVMAASQGAPPRRGERRLELADLIREQDDRVRELRAELDDLGEGLDDLSAGAAGASRSVGTLRREIRELEVLAGTAGLQGPGLTVTLDDSDVGRSPTGDPNDLIVHEQDIQAVVNALWAGGAEAISVNGDRLTSASAVRCAGNTLLLHGRVHSPPYRIEAIGEPAAMEDVLTTSAGMQRVRTAVSAFGLELQTRSGEVVIPSGGPSQSLVSAVPA